jgi:hypothetical protein
MYAGPEGAIAVRLFTRTLTGYPAGGVGGVGGLVGDLATDTGTPSEGGKTWTFTIRTGPSWEDGRPVTCQDVAYGIARSFARDQLPGGTPYPMMLLDIPSRVDSSGREVPGYAGPYAGSASDATANPSATESTATQTGDSDGDRDSERLRVTKRFGGTKRFGQRFGRLRCRRRVPRVNVDDPTQGPSAGLPSDRGAADLRALSPGPRPRRSECVRGLLVRSLPPGGRVGGRSGRAVRAQPRLERIQ